LLETKVNQLESQSEVLKVMLDHQDYLDCLDLMDLQDQLAFQVLQVLPVFLDFLVLKVIVARMLPRVSKVQEE
jgi:hypothetical protein